MNNRKTNILITLCILLSLGFIGTAFAYYEEKTASVTNTFIAAGAGEMFDFDNEDETLKGVFTLDESEAIIQDDGTYKLKTDSRKTGNSYKVMPGVNIPKDPMITIKNKSEIPAYLYIEITGDTSAYFTYSLTADWVKLEKANGAHKGDVYVYSPSNNSILGKVTTKEIYILKDNTLNTNATLSSSDELSLTFYAYLAQTGIGNETETYNTCFGLTDE